MCIILRDSCPTKAGVLKAHVSCNVHYEGPCTTAITTRYHTTTTNYHALEPNVHITHSRSHMHHIPLHVHPIHSMCHIHHTPHLSVLVLVTLINCLQCSLSKETTEEEQKSANDPNFPVTLSLLAIAPMRSLVTVGPFPLLPSSPISFLRYLRREQCVLGDLGCALHAMLSAG